MLSDQTNSCSHQVHGVLVLECTVPSLGLFVVRNNSSSPLFNDYYYYYSIIISFCTETKCSSDSEHSISLRLVCQLWFCTVAQVCVCVETFWTITGAFLTLADLYFAVSAVRLLIKLFTICCDSHFWEDLSVEPDFVRALLYWHFWYMPVAVPIWIIKPCCWQMFHLQAVQVCAVSANVPLTFQVISICA